MSTQQPPQPFEDAIETIRSTVRDATGVLLCLDFDGTLAPIVEDPDGASPTPANEAVVESLSAQPRITTAVVSGRALPDVRERIDGPTIYAGNHGLELERGGSVAVHPIAQKRARRLTALCSLLRETVGTLPNCRIENKRLTGTVHLRAVPSPAHSIVRDRTTELVDRFGAGSLAVSTGKQILEIGPAIPWGKGNAVELIESALPSGTVPVYLGDDVTDESAFEVVEPDGIGIRVGGDEPSAASVRVDSPEEVASALEWFGSTGVELLD